MIIAARIRWTVLCFSKTIENMDLSVPSLKAERLILKSILTHTAIP
jgi:hypothetical protein